MSVLTRSFRLVAFVLGALTVGCETFYDPNPADHQPLLAVDATFETGVPWSIVVSQTVSLGDTTGGYLSPPVQTATVTIAGSDGSSIVLPHNEQGRYGAALIRVEGPIDYDAPQFEDGPAPSPGVAYSLLVTAPGFEPARATSLTPQPLPALVADVAGGWEQIEAGGLTGYTDVELSVAPLPLPAHVLLEFVRGVAEADGCIASVGTFFTDAPTLMEATFLDDIQEGSDRSRYRSAVLDGSAQSGRSLLLTGERPGPCFVGVDFVALSDAAYEFRRSEERRRSAEGNPFAEPVPSYSNVDGGVGLFAGTTRARVRIAREN